MLGEKPLAMINCPAYVSELLYTIDQVLYPSAAQNWFVFYTLRFLQYHGPYEPRLLVFGSFASNKTSNGLVSDLCHYLSTYRGYRAYFDLRESPREY